MQGWIVAERKRRTLTRNAPLDSITRQDLSVIADEPPKKHEHDLEPIEAAALKVEALGLNAALDEAQKEAAEVRTAFRQAVLDVLNAAYENDPPQPNDCDECGRSFGPNYTGSCEH